MDPLKESTIYLQTIQKYERFHDVDGYINGTQKLLDSLGEVYLDTCFYLDFYSIEKYGKTKLGTLLFHAKQSQDKKLLSLLEPLIEKPISKLIERENITGYAFIPPSIDRKVQLLKEIEKDIALKIPRLDLKKIWRGTPIPQKSLSSIGDRVKNARDTIFVENKEFYTDTILLVDDALGSGATLNETAKKLKDAGMARKVIGLALVGSFKGFDIIREI